MFRLFITLLFFTLIFSFCVYAQTEEFNYVKQQKEALKNIKDFKFEVSYVFPETENFIKKKNLENNLKKFITQNGLFILPKPYSSDFKNAPIIHIIISFQPYDNDQQMIYSAIVEVSESVMLIRNKETQIKAITWQKSFFGMGKIKDSNQLLTLLKESLELLINDWKNINGKDVKK